MIRKSIILELEIQYLIRKEHVYIHEHVNIYSIYINIYIYAFDFEKKIMIQDKSWLFFRLQLFKDMQITKLFGNYFNYVYYRIL